MALPVYPHRRPPQQQGWGFLRQLARALLLDYDAVEGTGAVPPCRQYIKAAGSEGNEEVGRYVGWAVRSCWTTTPWRGDGRALSCLIGCTLSRRAVRPMKRLVVSFILSQ